jgi:uncharacterized protein
MNFEFASELPCTKELAFQYHERFGALERLIPPWEPIRIARSDRSIHSGAEVLLRMQLGLFSQSWLARHEIYDPPHQFSDRQLLGPFASWNHVHRFEDNPHSESHCRLIDRIEYQLPFGKLGQWLGQGFVERKLDRTFNYRHAITQLDLDLQKRLHAIDSSNASSKTIAITGSRGLVGSEIVRLLHVLGHRVIRIERIGKTSTSMHQPMANERATRWNPATGLKQPNDLEEVDAVIHLAGQGIADKRWSESVKEDLRRSRVESTQALSRQLSQLKQPPKVFVSASGVGIYGHAPGKDCREDDTRGNDFLARLAADWEEASSVLQSSNTTRVVHGRLGIVLSQRGGALKKMLPIFRLGLAGKLGSGQQQWSWIDLEDAAAAFVWLALHPTADGPYNLVANSHRNGEFTKQLSSLLRRPAFLPAPAWLLRSVLGEMADAMLLTCTRATNDRLLATGYPMRYAVLEDSLRHSLGL